MLFKNYIKIIYLNLFLQYTLDYTKKKKIICQYKISITIDLQQNIIYLLK